MVALYKRRKTKKEIINITGVGQITMYRWVQRFKDDSETFNPVLKLRSGSGRKVDQQTLNIMKRQTECDPHLTARELKKNNLGVFGEMFLRTVQRNLHDELEYCSCEARPKSLIKKKGKFCRIYSDWHIPKVWQLL